MKKVIYALMSFSPVLALAAIAPDVSGVTGLVNGIGQIISRVIPVMFALAIIYFFWGLIQFIRSAGDAKKASEGKSIMIYGVIAIFVMVSIYGLVNWLQGTLGVGSNTNIPIPCVPGIPCTN